eukprot:365852-Chlamydomonas_euryale.AAC.10
MMSGNAGSSGTSRTSLTSGLRSTRMFWRSICGTRQARTGVHALRPGQGKKKGKASHEQDNRGGWGVRLHFEGLHRRGRVLNT